MGQLENDGDYINQWASRAMGIALPYGYSNLEGYSLFLHGDISDNRIGSKRGDSVPMGYTFGIMLGCLHYQLNHHRPSTWICNNRISETGYGIFASNYCSHIFLVGNKFTFMETNNHAIHAYWSGIGGFTSWDKNTIHKYNENAATAGSNT